MLGDRENVKGLGSAMRLRTAKETSSGREEDEECSEGEVSGVLPSRKRRVKGAEYVGKLVVTYMVQGS